MKKQCRILSVILVAVMIFPTAVFAESKRKVRIERNSNIISVQSKEMLGLNTENVESNSIAVEELLSRSKHIAVTKAGDVSGKFTSTQIETSTPGVKWGYEVAYTISPMPNGMGWYFKNVRLLEARTYERFLSRIWKVEITNCVGTLPHTTYPTSFTASIDLKFTVRDVSREYPGEYPGEYPEPSFRIYCESHKHTTKISNVYDY